jgi:hypothetical protein
MTRLVHPAEAEPSAENINPLHCFPVSTGMVLIRNSVQHPERSITRCNNYSPEAWHIIKNVMVCEDIFPKKFY